MEAGEGSIIKEVFMDIPYQEINSKTIDRWVEEGWEWGKPVYV